MDADSSPNAVVELRTSLFNEPLQSKIENN